MNEYDFLAHHGVKGMKWGVRRYQNEDGTLTPEGERHYGRKAARKHYKAERNKIRRDNANTFITYKNSGKRARKAEAKAQRLEGGLSKEAIDRGRLKVASSRKLKFGVAGVASAAETAMGVAFLASQPAIGLPMSAIGAYSTAKSIGRTAYYTREKYNYSK